MEHHDTHEEEIAEEELMQSDESYNYWRKETGKHLLIMANIFVAGLVVGQFTADRVDWAIMTVGAIATVLLYIFAIRLMQNIV